MTLSVQVVHDVDEFRELEAAWDRLAGRFAFRQFAWAWNWWLAYEDRHRELFVLVVRDEDRNIVSIAPFTLDQSLAHGKRLTLLGGGEACGDGLSILCSQADVKLVAETLSKWLNEGPGNGRWDLIYLDGVETSDTMVALLRDYLLTQGVTTTTREDDSRWVVKLPDDWNTYIATLGKRTRRTMRQLENRRQMAGSDIETRAPRNLDEVGELFEQLVTLHNQRWKSTSQKGAFDSHRFRLFLQESARCWFKQDKLLLQVLCVDQTPAAGAIGLKHEKGVHLFLLGRNPKFDKQQPGWLLNNELLQQAIAEGCTDFDFLRGNEPYKAKLGGQPIPQCRVSLFAPGALNRFRGQVTTWVSSAARLRQIAGHQLENSRFAALCNLRLRKASAS